MGEEIETVPPSSSAKVFYAGRGLAQGDPELGPHVATWAVVRCVFPKAHTGWRSLHPLGTLISYVPILNSTQLSYRSLWLLIDKPVA